MTTKTNTSGTEIVCCQTEVQNVRGHKMCAPQVSLIAFIVICAGLHVLTSMEVSATNKTEMRVGFWGAGSYECSSNEIAYYIGGTYGISIKLWPEGIRPRDLKYTGITDWTWPEGLEINVAQLLSPSESFQPSTVLRNRLQFEYYITAMQASMDSLWRTGVVSSSPMFSAPEYHIAFLIPPELDNSYLCVSVEWSHPKYGHLDAQPICTKIVKPCSEVAQHQVWTTQVMMAQDQEKYELAVALADSFISKGWHEIHGLQAADNAARHLKRYEDAIRYIDICFEWNHTIFFLPEQPLPSAPTEETHRLYQMNRTRLLELKEQQQDQNEER